MVFRQILGGQAVLQQEKRGGSPHVMQTVVKWEISWRAWGSWWMRQIVPEVRPGSGSACNTLHVRRVVGQALEKGEIKALETIGPAHWMWEDSFDFVTKYRVDKFEKEHTSLFLHSFDIILPERRGYEWRECTPQHLHHSAEAEPGKMRPFISYCPTRPLALPTSRWPTLMSTVLNVPRHPDL